MHKSSMVALLALILSGCAGMQQAYRDQVCNTNGGYEQGMNDSRAGKPMDQSFARVCEGPSHDTALQGYRDGYTAGLASLQADKPATQINVNFGSSTEQKYYCEVRAFTKTFSAWGPSELEAQVEAKKRCTAEYHEMHCQNVNCRHS